MSATDWARVGDMLAIPFFVLALVHYTALPLQKTWVDHLLLLFFATALVVDTTLVAHHYLAPHSSSSSTISAGSSSSSSSSEDTTVSRVASGLSLRMSGNK
jgi:hypothetical protein